MFRVFCGRLLSAFAGRGKGVERNNSKIYNTLDPPSPRRRRGGTPRRSVAQPGRGVRLNAAGGALFDITLRETFPRTVTCLCVQIGALFRPPRRAIMKYAGKTEHA